MEQQFEKASRMKLRFNTERGLLSVEDLWDLPLTTKSNRLSLDEVAKDLHRQIKAAENDIQSFVTPQAETSTPKYDALHLQFEIAKHIIGVKVAEQNANAVAQERSRQKQKLMEVLSQKQDAALENKSVEEIQAMINAL